MKAAVKHGFLSDSEDLAHDVLLTFLEKPKSGRTVDQALIDAIRKDRGRLSKNSVDGQPVRRRGTRVHVRLDRAHKVAGTDKASRTGVKPLDEDILKLLSTLVDRGVINRIQHAIIILSLGWEFTYAEIAVLFRFSTMHIYELLRSAERELRSELDQEKNRIEKKRHPNE